MWTASNNERKKKLDEIHLVRRIKCRARAEKFKLSFITLKCGEKRMKTGEWDCEWVRCDREKSRGEKKQNGRVSRWWARVRTLLMDGRRVACNDVRDDCECTEAGLRLLRSANVWMGCAVVVTAFISQFGFGFRFSHFNFIFRFFFSFSRSLRFKYPTGRSRVHLPHTDPVLKVRTCRIHRLILSMCAPRQRQQIDDGEIWNYRNWTAFGLPHNSASKCVFAFGTWNFCWLIKIESADCTLKN